ncbi:MAG: hypothetical protein R2825_02010 [Saprospiraceae bacterium]
MHQLKEIKVDKYPPIWLKYHAQRKFLSFVFDVSKSNDLYPCFDVSKPKLSTICDYILFYEKRKKRNQNQATLFVFLCNLKSGRRSGSSEQVKASKLLAEYIVNTAIRLLKYKNFSIEYRAITFSTDKTMKFKTNLRNNRYELLGESKLLAMNLKAGGTYVLDLLAQ